MPFPLSDHSNGVHFHNVGGEKAPSLGKVMVWQLGRILAGQRQDAGPVSEEKTQPQTESGATVTFLGHASFLLRGNGWNCLLDPVLSDTVGPGFGLNYRRFQKASPDWDGLPEPDFVLLTHNHYDHCDKPTLRRLAGASMAPVAVAPLGNGKLLRGMGFKEVVELDWWETWLSPKGQRVTLTPAVHFSARGPFDRNRSLWGGFFVDAGEARIFAAGDTGYGGHFRDIAQRLGQPSLALLPIGANEPANLMKHIHMGPAEALQAHRDLGCPASCAFHFGTFRLADDTLHGPAHELVALREAAGIPAHRFVVPRPGQILPAGD